MSILGRIFGKSGRKEEPHTKAPEQRAMKKKTPRRYVGNFLLRSGRTATRHDLKCLEICGARIPMLLASYADRKRYIQETERRKARMQHAKNA